MPCYGSYGKKSTAKSRAKTLKSKGYLKDIRINKDKKSRVQGYGQSYSVYAKY